MPIFVSAFLIGIIVAGLRAMMAPTMVSRAACCGWLNLDAVAILGGLLIVSHL